MSLATDIQEFAALCLEGAKRANAEALALGPRPEGPPVDVILWDNRRTSLRNRVQTLAALAGELSAEAVLEALQEAEEPLAHLKSVTDQAQARIARIKKLSNLLKTLGAVIDVGVAVLALAASPSVDGATAVVKKIEALAKAASGEADDEEEDADKAEKKKPGQ